MNLDTVFTLFTKTNSKWIIDLCKMQNCETPRRSLFKKHLGDTGFDNEILHMTAKEESMKERKLIGFLKIEDFCSAKDTVKRMKDNIFTRKYLQNIYLIKDW